MPNILTSPTPHVTKTISLSSYSKLRNDLQKIILTAQKAVQKIGAYTCWQVGKKINQTIGRAKTPYLPRGEHVIEKLAQDFGMKPKRLYLYSEIAQKWPKFPPAEISKMSHLLEVLPIKDVDLQSRLLKQTVKEDWSAKRLRAEVKRLKSGGKRPTADRRLQTGLLKPRLGKLHTYRVISNQEFGLQDTGEFLFDHGFRFFSPFSKKIPVGTVEIQNGNVISSARTDKDRYFHEAKVEKGIDGDTFWTVIDCGLGHRTEQKLRLRGINAAETGQYGASAKLRGGSASAGKKATQFLNCLLPPGSRILLKTSKSPNHDRFVADVYVEWKEAEGRIGKKMEEEGKNINQFDPSSSLLFPLLPSSSSKYLFVNNLLLALGLVKRMEE